jgi:hypothetical protein
MSGCRLCSTESQSIQFTWHQSHFLYPVYHWRNPATIAPPDELLSAGRFLFSHLLPSTFSIPISEKLTKANYSLWRAQVLPAIRAAQLEDLLTGHEATAAKTVSVTVGNKKAQQPNPAYAKWVARDQSVLGYLLSSLTREALLHVTTCTTAADVWHTLASLYSTQTRTRSVSTHIALTTTRKNQLSISDYFAKMRGYSDEMASTGNAITDAEFISYVLAGLDEDYNSVFTAVVARIDTVTPAELYT